jgi:hypothetical protein
MNCRRSLLLILALVAGACSDSRPAAPPPPPEPMAIEDVVRLQRFELPDGVEDEGRRLALTHCQMCHVFPEPHLLDRHTWQKEMLPRMGARLGMHHVDPTSVPGIIFGKVPEEQALLDASGIYPEEPHAPPESWERIKAYYLKNAPGQLPTAEVERPIPRTLKQFRAVPWRLKRYPPATTLVHIDEERHELIIGDMITKSLTRLSPKGDVLEDVFLDQAAVSLRRRGDELWAVGIGSVTPSDLPTGDLIVLQAPVNPGGPRPGRQVLHTLKRPVHAAYGDLTGDGREDIVLCEYGHQLGRLTMYEDLGDGDFQRHVLSANPGALVAHVADMNHDGRLDVVALFGQYREGVLIYYNEGGGKFVESYVVQTPPSYGSSHMRLLDFDGDGHQDLLVTNGDNADYDPILKPYHGIRLYVNDGRNGFEEAFFYPLNGAYKALAEDFDGDGDLDLAAISMFADYETQPEEGFVFLRNEGKLRFTASTIPEVDSGRWLTMDAGDLDGDGDTDIVLGSFVVIRNAVPEPLFDAWHERKMPLLFLENMQR